MTSFVLGSCQNCFFIVRDRNCVVVLTHHCSLQIACQTKDFMFGCPLGDTMVLKRIENDDVEVS